jgi:hypothetical protein
MAISFGKKGRNSFRRTQRVILLERRLRVRHALTNDVYQAGVWICSNVGKCHHPAAVTAPKEIAHSVGWETPTLSGAANLRHDARHLARTLVASGQLIADSLVFCRLFAQEPLRVLWSFGGCRKTLRDLLDHGPFDIRPINESQHVCCGLLLLELRAVQGPTQLIFNLSLCSLEGDWQGEAGPQVGAKKSNEREGYDEGDPKNPTVRRIAQRRLQSVTQLS